MKNKQSIINYKDLEILSILDFNIATPTKDIINKISITPKTLSFHMNRLLDLELVKIIRRGSTNTFKDYLKTKRGDKILRWLDKRDN